MTKIEVLLCRLMGYLRYLAKPWFLLIVCDVISRCSLTSADSSAEPKSVLPLRQCFAVLKAIEDLQTVTSRVYAQCEECFQAAIAAFEGQSAPAAPRELLKKSMSSMTSAGSFSLVGSSMLDSRTTEGSGSRALVKPEEAKRRGWDWRKGLAKDAKGEDVLRILRLSLAKDIARHWITDEAS